MVGPVSETVQLALADAAEPLHLLVHDEQDQYVSQTLRDTGVWEPFESKLILNALQEGSCFVDVGANIGYFSLLAAQRVGSSGHVLAFEPDPLNYQLLTDSVALNKLSQVTAVNAGLSEHNQSAALHLSANNFGDHQLFPARARAEDRESVRVELLNGSDYLTTFAANVDFIKVDVQGAEYQVVNGLMPWLKQQRQLPKLLIELTPYALRQAGSSGRQLMQLLGELLLPVWIVDHTQHQLVASDIEELAIWCDNVDSCADDEGFMNIMLTP